MIVLKDYEDDPLRAADGIVRGTWLSFILWAALILAWVLA